MAEDKPNSHGSDFRRFLPDLTTPRFQAMQRQDAREYAEAFKTSGQPPWLHGLYLHWLKLFKEPFKGITNDGACTNAFSADCLAGCNLGFACCLLGMKGAC
jgi:hypothetical protein